MCEKLAERYGEDPKRAMAVGLAHDMAKEMPEEEKMKYVKENKIQSLSPRTHYLQQYFPKTISAICNEMNLRDEIDAIEYYGT